MTFSMGELAYHMTISNLRGSKLHRIRFLVDVLQRANEQIPDGGNFSTALTGIRSSN